MAGFLKKIFSFGKKEVVEGPSETPGLRTDGDELKPINWAALKDLTKEDDSAAEAAAKAEREAAEAKAVAEAKAAEDAARAAELAAREAAEKAEREAEAAKAAEEAARKLADEKAAREAEELASREAAARDAAQRAADEKAAREAAELKAAEDAARRATEQAEAKAAQEKAEREAAEARAAAEAALRAAEAAATEEARQAALEAKAQADAAAEAAAAREAEERAAREAAEAKAAEDAARRATEEQAARDAAESAARETEALAVREAEERAAREAEEAEERAAVEAEARVAAEKAAQAKAAAERAAAEKAAAEKAAAEARYSVGLRTGGEELAAPAWMQQPAKPAPEPEPEPEDDDPTNKVTVGKTVEAKQARVAPAPEVKLPWFQRLQVGMRRSAKELSNNISGVFTKRKLDEDTLQDLEDVLLRADLGMETAMRVTDTLSATRHGREVTDLEVRAVMGAEIEKVLTPVAKPLELDLSHKPHVILVVGVNGTGKTTTIGKLAAKLKDGGLSVMLAAGDTFRAAAIEQLKIWGERTGSPVISSKLGADAAGLAYDAFEQAREAGSDVLIIDTAGRLQNKAELMAELEKIVRVLGKLDPEAPHTVLQTIDATTGQNALNQVEIFRNVAGVNGLVLTKLDGTARGGILVAIAAKHKLPVYFIGVGEQVDDLEPFVAGDFAKAIAGVG